MQKKQLTTTRPNCTCVMAFQPQVAEGGVLESSASAFRVCYVRIYIVTSEMDRGWPWKKKTSDKTITEKTAATSGSDKASLASVASLSDKENYNKVNYVQISLDSYTHMTGFEAQVNTLEGQVKILEDQVKDLNKKLSEAHSEITMQESLVEQHAKVAEEAVSGWEKANAEALALKLQLESITLLRLTAEDRASHLDGALKECMKQVRCVKEENEQRLHEVILTKTEQWDKIKLELEGKIVDLDQELLRSSAQNAALSKSLQDHSNMLMKIKEEKFQAEANIEHLKGNIQSYEKEINSLKSCKQATLGMWEENCKLEAECQRLRGLVRKKLPGPAALAQMKLEVENLGQNFHEPRLRTPVKSPNLHLSQLSEFSNETLQQNQKEIEFLTTRLLAMEDETKMLKEALAARNHELQTSRSMCAKVAGRLKSLEAQQDLIQQRSSPRSNYGVPTEGSSSQNGSNPASVASMSEDGIDEEGSCVESLATSLISDLPHCRGNKRLGKSRKHNNSNHLDLMDDFLEMERLAHSSNHSNGVSSIIKDLNNEKGDIACHSTLVDVAKSGNLPSEWPTDSNSSPNQVSSCLESSAIEHGLCVDHLLLLKLQSRISIILESQTTDTDKGKILEEIKCAMQDIQDSMHQQLASCFYEGTHPDDASHNWEACPQDTRETKDSKILLGEDGKPCTGKEHVINQNLVAAVSQIHQFVLSLGKEAMQVPDTSTVRNEIIKNIEDFSTSVDKFLFNKLSLVEFFLGLSHILIKASELKSSVLDCKGHEGETTTFDCIDKVALLENKVVKDESSRQGFPRGCDYNSHSTSDPEILQEENLSPGFWSDLSSCKCSLKDLELLQSCKDNMEMDLARCTQDLESTRLQLKEMEQLLTELKSQLALSQKSRSLAETQLKCMTESYKSLELHAQELEAEVISLQEKMENLNYELQEEKDSHQDALARCEDLQEQLQRVKSHSMSLLSSAAELDEREIAAAAEKLAECQQTIDILGRQLKSMQPQSKFIESRDSRRLQSNEGLVGDKPCHSVSKKQAVFNSSEFYQADMLHASPTATQDMGEKLLHISNSPSSPSNVEPNLLPRSPISPSHHHNKPKKSSSSSAMLAPEKHLRGFSSFFASRGKKGNGR
ncbi:Filament-like plant protein 4 [Vitis vinifera]|uniref:Filament-like plant protein 4 n=1 Tax=Vitis vinifera TaxID=29760 RepID=A0A438EUW7_VITVI|nr:Filament-like plant protein 4 [Vitis vinifera]